MVWTHSSITTWKRGIISILHEPKDLGDHTPSPSPPTQKPTKIGQKKPEKSIRSSFGRDELLTYGGFLPLPSVPPPASPNIPFATHATKFLHCNIAKIAQKQEFSPKLGSKLQKFCSKFLIGAMIRLKVQTSNFIKSLAPLAYPNSELHWWISPHEHFLQKKFWRKIRTHHKVAQRSQSPLDIYVNLYALQKKITIGIKKKVNSSS